MWVEDVAGCGKVAFTGCRNGALVVAALRLVYVCGRGRSNALAYLLRPAVRAKCVSWGVRHPVAVASCFLPPRPSRRAQLIGSAFRGFRVVRWWLRKAFSRLRGTSARWRDRARRAKTDKRCCLRGVPSVAILCLGHGGGCPRCAVLRASSCTSVQLRRTGGMDSLQRRSAKCAMGRSGCGEVGASGGYAMPGVRVHAITSISQRPATWVVVIVWVNCVAGSPGRISVSTSV